MKDQWRYETGRQLGLVTTAQLTRAGVTRARRETLLRSGTLVRVHPNVYRLAGSPVSVAQRRLAAVLGLERAALSHAAAAGAWGAELMSEAPPELLVPVGCSNRMVGVVVHRSRDLRKSDIMAFPPFPRIARPALALLQLAADPRIHDAALEEIGADLLLRWPKERGRLRATLGRQIIGHGAARRVADMFGDLLAGDRRPPHPGLERRLLALIRACPEIPPPVVHLRLQTPAGLIEFDLAWPDARLAVEADSARWHSSPSHLRTDRARDQAAASVGWQTLRFTSGQVLDEPSDVIGCIEAVLLQRCVGSRRS